MKTLEMMQKGNETLRAIEGLSENDIRILQTIKEERPNFLNLNATAHYSLRIDNALEIVGKLTQLGLITEIDRR